MQASYSQKHITEYANVATGSDASSHGFDYSLLESEEQGDIWSLLSEASFSLCVSREYEHFIVALDGKAGGAPWQSPFPLPHPSGLCFDETNRNLIFSSTRTPNIIMWFEPQTGENLINEIVPGDVSEPEGTLFLPRKSRYLPGSLYIHDLVISRDEKLYATVTGHNFLASIDFDTGWQRVWHPKIVETKGKDAFRENNLQLNSVAWGQTPEESFYTGFSDSITGVKPWKDGYGPEGKGIVFSGKTRETLLSGLTCPHSARFHEGRLWVCNSGFGSVGYIDNYHSHDPQKTKYIEVLKVPGFTRGLAFAGRYGFVGLSRVIPKYEPYAPGIPPHESKCGIVCFDTQTGQILASLYWHSGYQIYDVQVLPDVKLPQMPLGYSESYQFNDILRFYG